MTGETMAAELARLRYRIEQLERRATRTATITAVDSATDTCTIAVPTDDAGTVELPGIPLGRSYARVGTTVQLVQTGHTPVAVPPADRLVAGSITAVERGSDGSQLIPDPAAQDTDLRTIRIDSLASDGTPAEAAWSSTTTLGRTGWHLRIGPDGGDDHAITWTVAWPECPPSRTVTVRGQIARVGTPTGTLDLAVEYYAAEGGTLLATETHQIVSGDVSTSAWTTVSATLGPPSGIDTDTAVTHVRVVTRASDGGTSSSSDRWLIADLTATAGLGDTGPDRATLTPDGLRVFESDVEVISLVSGQPQRLRTVDPITGQTLASLSDTGRVYGRVIDAPSIQYLGTELASTIQSGPRGVIAHDTMTAASSSVSSETVIKQVTGHVEEGRTYIIKTNPFRAQRATSDADAVFRIRISTSGTVTTSGTIVAQTALRVRADSARTPIVLESAPIAFDFGAADAADLSVGITIAPIGSGTVQTVAAPAYPLAIYIVDEGTYVLPGDNGGEISRVASWSGTYDTGDGINPLDSKPWPLVGTTDDDVHIGRRHTGPDDTDNRLGMIGMPAALTTDWAAATTLEYLDLTVVWDGVGTKTEQSVDIGYHGYTSRPASILGTDTITLDDATETGIPTPGTWKWRVPTSWHADIAAGDIRGVILGPNQAGNDTTENDSYNGVIGGLNRDSTTITWSYRVY